MYVYYICCKLEINSLSLSFIVIVIDTGHAVIWWYPVWSMRPGTKRRFVLGDNITPVKLILKLENSFHKYVILSVSIDYNLFSNPKRGLETDLGTQHYAVIINAIKMSNIPLAWRSNCPVFWSTRKRIAFLTAVSNGLFD